MYTTPKQIVDIFGPTEISKIATPRKWTAIDPILLEKTVNYEDRSEYTAEEIEQADYVLLVIEQAVADADSEMNSYLVQRYKTPIDEDIVALNPVLESRCADIARYRLAKSHPSKEMYQRYENSIIWLTGIVKNSISLDTEDSSEDLAQPSILTKEHSSRFDWRDYYGIYAQ